MTTWHESGSLTVCMEGQVWRYTPDGWERIGDIDNGNTDAELSAVELGDLERLRDEWRAVHGVGRRVRVA